jgi:hypothetical protein
MPIPSLERVRSISSVSASFIRHAKIIMMEVGNIRLYKDRWHAVEEIERQELRAMTPSQHWQKLNAIVRFALETGMETEKDNSEMEVFRRWARLRSAA